MNFKLATQLVKNMGLRYTSYRVFNVFEQKSGRLKKKHPMHVFSQNFISFDGWRKSNFSFLNLRSETKNPTQVLEEKASRILSGEILFFSSEWKNIGLDYNWITNPVTGFEYDISKHWSEIPDLAKEAGDIKFVWEKSRFSFLQTILRYDFHFGKNNAEFIFSQIENWIDMNPVNQGPNWRCSQEISLRIFNWCFALDFYKNDKALTKQRWDKIQNTIYWSLHHVYHHIDFSRIAVRNNHAITETLFLTLSELLFPFIPETKKWAKVGRKYFEEEIDYQIYDDGTFLQFSMNYHRVVIQLLSLGITISEKYKKPFSDNVYKKAYKSLNFLYQCLQEENGYLPNYGANDGALFFPLSDRDYRDYRPQLNSLHKIITGNYIYKENYLIEDFLDFELDSKKMNNLTKVFGSQSFDVGGYYICRNSENFTFIRCGNHKNKPVQADNLHIDIWKDGENIMRDSGTYKYNTDDLTQSFFKDTLGHNTVMIDEKPQMLRGSRFMWFYWTQRIDAKWSENNDYFIFSGEISAYRYLNKKIRHNRKVFISKSKDKWIVEDSIFNADNYSKKQLWHYDDFNWNWKLENELEVEDKKSFNSEYYGIKNVGKCKQISFSKKIKTTFYI
ncbi:heparinase II/III-family protein [Aureivirga sp. CE67]|uniref:heparinase II/III family protein n=1 Tax=Aureivirga sp. CE67 TaxID=1788983 RepID=UPI001E59977A|nr:heparinase II/III-family protein [Aureivirga sp. CE67]